MSQIKSYCKLLWLGVFILFLPAVTSANVTTPPPQPSGFNADVYNSYIYLSWNDVSGENQYIIERAEQAIDDWGTIAYLTIPNATSYEDRTVAPNGIYDYRLRACLDSLCSDPAELFGVQAGPGGTVSAPLNLNASAVSSTSIALTWEDKSTNENKFLIFRKLSAQNAWPTSHTAQVGTDIVNYTDINLTPGTAYDYYVVACYNATCSGWSNIASATTHTTGSTNTCTGLTLTTDKPSYVIGELVTWTWTCSSGVATSMGIELQKPDTTKTLISLKNYSPGQSTWSQNFSTSNYSQGDYTLRACFNFTTTACTTIDASTDFKMNIAGGGDNYYSFPTNVLASQPNGATYINISWTSPTYAPPYYKIERSVNSGAYTTLISGIISSYHSDYSSLTPGYIYTYIVYSCSTYTTCSTTGSTPASVTYSSSGDGNIPQTPASLSAQVSGTSVSLGWYSISGYTYKLYRKPYSSADSSWVSVCGSSVTVSPCTDAPIPIGSYQYRIEACSSATNCSGTNYNVWVFSTPPIVEITGNNTDIPLAPSNLTVVTATATNIKIMWVDNANNEDKFNVGRKLSSAAIWSTTDEVQVQGSNNTAYNDTSVISGTTYDYRVQACRSSYGCSDYTYLSGVTAGSSTQEYRAVTVKMANNTIVPYGAVNFVHDGIILTAVFINSSSTTINLLPGEYEMQPGFPGVNNDVITLTGSQVNNRKLNLANINTEVTVTLPQRLSVSITVKNSVGQPLSNANVIAYIPGTTVYASAFTSSTGTAWLQLPAGTYQGKVIKPGYLTHTTNWIISDSTTEFTITLESLPVKVSGRVLAVTTPKANAIVRAVNNENNSSIIVSSDSLGEYSIYLSTGTWYLSAISDGYVEGSGSTVTLSNTDQTKDLTLGPVKQLISSSANIVPTVSVTVTAAELGVALGLPANSLGGGSSATVTIRESTQSVATPLAAPLPRSVRDISAVSGGQSITNLAESASIELSYIDSDITSLGVGSSDLVGLKVAYWNITNNDWQILASTVDTANHKVRAATNHFTLFAIVLPFLVQPAAAETTAPEVLAPNEERATQLATMIAEGTKVYVSCSECLASSVNKTRDEALEQKYDKDIVSRVVGADTITVGARTTIINFITYGTTTTISLGAGERGGVVASFRSAYGHLPNSEYDWQEILKIANGRWPGTLLPEREEAMKTTFSKVYLREAVVQQINDSAALSIMAYGLRSAKRSLTSEKSAIQSFLIIYGHSPASASDWDAVRAIAYSGAKR